MALSQHLPHVFLLFAVFVTAIKSVISSLSLGSSVRAVIPPPHSIPSYWWVSPQWRAHAIGVLLFRLCCVVFVEFSWGGLMIVVFGDGLVLLTCPRALKYIMSWSHYFIVIFPQELTNQGTNLGKVNP